MEPVSNLGKFGRALMVLVGILFLAAGIFLTVSQNTDEKMIECKAVITGFPTMVRSDTNISYSETTVQFTLPGTSQNIEATLGQFEKSWKIGDTLTILVDKNDPQIIRTKTMTYGGWLLILISMPFIIIGLYMIMSIRRRAAKTPEEIAEDEERTTAGKLKYKVSSIVIPFSAGIPVTAMGIIFLYFENNSALGLLSLILGGVSIYAGIHSVIVYIIIKYRHYKDKKNDQADIS